MQDTQLSLTFFLQLVVILGACRLVGLLARRVGQPQVVGEIIAGILLGPSLLGLFWPAAQQEIFPKGTSMSILYTVSQIGLVLYMFVIGVDFDANLIRNRMRSAVSVSLAGILTPMALGACLALFLFNQGGLFPHGISPGEAILFVGTAISITAFPVLARIIVESRLAGTSLGTLALAAGSIDDVISWCIMALILAIFKQNPLVVLLAVGGGVLYTVGMLTLGKTILARTLGTMAERQRALTNPMLAVVLLLLMFCAWLTDTIGIYAIFGGFILGVAMPRGLVSTYLKTILEPLVTSFLLPLFFVYSGLNTRVGLLNSWLLWGSAALILVTAVAGKGVACWLAALLNKEPQHEALAIGSLMNTRGLVELILLNLGLQQGIITPTLFTMLVIMAIFTTLMTSPLFELVYGRYRDRNLADPQSSEASTGEATGIKV